VASESEQEAVQPRRFELGTDGPTAILVGIDGSETSLRAGAYAAGLARRQGAKLICVFVRQTMGMAYAAEVSAAAAVTSKEISDQVRTMVQEQSTQWHIPADFVTCEGDPFAVITGIAQEVSADAVVVGASTRLGHKLAGSLAIRLVKHGHFPVTVVP
jgi:nucleotide-binding universal stress UspA family protein